jgi:hypothetical protein
MLVDHAAGPHPAVPAKPRSMQQGRVLALRRTGLARYGSSHD